MNHVSNSMEDLPSNQLERVRLKTHVDCSSGGCVQLLQFVVCSVQVVRLLLQDLVKLVRVNERSTHETKECQQRDFA